MNPNPNPIVHPGADEARIRDAIKYLGMDDIERAETCAMICGVNCAQLGKHTIPPVLAQHERLAPEWTWGHGIGIKGIEQRLGPAQGMLI